MHEPEWHDPESLEGALRLRAQLGDAAMVVAGGTFTGILIGQRLVRPEAFLYLGGIPGLDRIEVDGELRLGALVRHRAVELSPEIRRRWPSLSRTFALVASPRVRNQATVGGALCDADYASDPPAMFVALDASVRLTSQSGSRAVKVEDFITGHYSTELRDDELLTEVTVPAAPARATYLKFRSRSVEDRPCVAVAAAADLEPDGGCRGLRVVAGAVAERPVLLREACALALGRRLDSATARQVGDAYADAVETLSDVRGSSAYRRRVLGVIVRRALEELAA